MARKNRQGGRKSREQRRRLNVRVPELGYYILVTNTKETEPCYFEGLKNSLPDDLRGRLVIKVVTISTEEMIDECLRLSTYHPQYCIPWIIFDRDRVPDFTEIIEKAQRKGIHVGWSNPCFETWLYAYFGSMPNIEESTKYWKKFAQVFEKKTGQEYSKSDENIYEKLCRAGDEEEAIKVAQRQRDKWRREGRKNPSDMCPGTSVDILVDEIKSHG